MAERDAAPRLTGDALKGSNMSYSFATKAATKELAKVAARAEFDKIVAAQGVHARDRAAVLANVDSVIDLLADDDTKGVSVHCNGYVSWPGPDNTRFNTVSVSCTASHCVL